MTDKPLRHVRIEPYLSGHGPTFDLKTWDTGRPYRPGASQWGIGYDFRETGAAEPLFSGEDFGCSPMDAIDSDDCLRTLLSFLTLRPGDTDAEYFDDYTEAQHTFAAEHAENVSLWAMEDDGMCIPEPFVDVED